MRKDGIQTRKRKPKKSANGAKSTQEASKKDGQCSPGVDGKFQLCTGHTMGIALLTFKTSRGSVQYMTFCSSDSRKTLNMPS